ncbi:hypothetical protein ACSBR1_014128 [Camellia fascicularis]
MLIYEFIPNGTLSQHIHDPNEEFPLSWEMRFRIATEVAGALSYLHCAASIPIYHRDMKSTNILLDDKYKAKVSDFGTSTSIDVDNTHLTTRVQGTFGYLDPEYFQSSQFTDKNTFIKPPKSNAGIIIAGGLFLLIASWWFYKVIKKRNDKKRKEIFFKRNGDFFLQHKLSSSDGSVEKNKLFNSKELEKATDHYNEDRILGQGGQGKVEQFINEVVVLSQIIHRNIVKLLGCCLETDVPLLVFEFIPNGTLSQHIHDPNEEFPLSWEMRFRIATEVAGALSTCSMQLPYPSIIET